MGRSMTNGPNARLPQKKEADPQEVWEVHNLPKAQEVTSLTLQDLSGVSPSCFHKSLTWPPKQREWGDREEGILKVLCVVHQFPNVFLLLFTHHLRYFIEIVPKKSTTLWWTKYYSVFVFHPPKTLGNLCHLNHTILWDIGSMVYLWERLC